MKSRREVVEHGEGNEQEAKCQSCGNIGTDLLGKHEACDHGRQDAQPERKANADAADNSSTEAKRGAQEQAELRAQTDEERRGQERADVQAGEAVEPNAREAAERAGKQDADENTREPEPEDQEEEGEPESREEAELEAEEDAERRARAEEAGPRPREEAEPNAGEEEAARAAAEEAERKSQEEAGLKAKKVADSEAHDEAELKPKEIAEFKAREEAELHAGEEAERRRKCDDEESGTGEAEREARKEDQHLSGASASEDEQQQQPEEEEEEGQESCAPHATSTAPPSMAMSLSFCAKMKLHASRARERAAKRMAEEEREMKNTAEEEDETWQDDGRVFPRPNRARFKWVLRTCFEHDWELVRDTDAVPPSERAEVEEALKSKYMWVLPLYRRLSTQDTVASGSCPDGISQFGVSIRSALQLLGPGKEGIGILDRTNLTKAIAENLYKKANHAAPEEASKLKVSFESRLSRYQFAQWLLRVARAKHPAAATERAIDLLFTDLAELCGRYSGDMRNLWEAGSSDEAQAIYERIAPQAYAVFCKQASIDERRFGEVMMSLSDWRKLLTSMNIFQLCPAIKKKYVAYTYRMGLDMVADEQYNQTWQFLSFKEFQRALGGLVFLGEFREKGECPAQALAELLLQLSARDPFPAAARAEPKKSRRKS